MKDEPLDRVGEALVLIGCRDTTGGPLDLSVRPMATLSPAWANMS